MNSNIGTILREKFGYLNYEQIVLFGSRARGNFSEKSDYDILIILKESVSIKEKMNLSTKIRRELAKLGIDTDVIIKSKPEVAYYKDRVGNIVRAALREGLVL